jgi:ABC-2 type transport system permease protein
MTAWLYATPIIYPIEIVPEGWRRLFVLNPLFHLCALVRDPIFRGHSAPLESWVVAVVASLATALLGWWFFTRRRDAFGYL